MPDSCTFCSPKSLDMGVRFPSCGHFLGVLDSGSKESPWLLSVIGKGAKKASEGSMIAGDYFITPHAVEQFRARIAPWMSYEQALGAIITELRDSQGSRPTENGKAHYVRTKGKWCFRAIIQPGESKPAVITILRSGKGRKRSRRLRTTVSVKEGVP